MTAGTLRRDQDGAAAIEMAFALPILLLFVYGIFMLGVMFQANAGIQNALGEGARYATIYPVPTDPQIRTRISDKVFGIGVGEFSPPVVTDGTGYKDLTVSFSMTPQFIFFEAPPITITRTKRVYSAS